MGAIKGYNPLSDADLLQINTIKDMEIKVGVLWRLVVAEEGCDQRWAAIGKTHLQEGFSALVRSITRPDDVY